MNKNKNKEKGFTFVEMMISVLFVSIALVAIFGVTTKYIQQTKQERESFTAALLGQEAVEKVKNMRDKNWIDIQNSVPGVTWKTGLTSCSSGCHINYDDTSLAAYSGQYLYIENSSGFYKYLASPGASDVKTIYQRKITITEVGIDELDVVVDIYFKDKTVTIRENIYNWLPW